MCGTVVLPYTKCVFVGWYYGWGVSWSVRLGGDLWPVTLSFIGTLFIYFPIVIFSCTTLLRSIANWDNDFSSWFFHMSLHQCSLGDVFLI